MSTDVAQSEELLDMHQQHLLFEYLQSAFVTVDSLMNWLQKHFTEGQSRVGNGDLPARLHDLMQFYRALNGMRPLMQALVDYPPHSDLPAVIYLVTKGTVRASQGRSDGLAQVASYKSWFVAGRPFVNRTNLRNQLEQLAWSEGAEAVLVIEGARKTGKTMATSLAKGFVKERPLRRRIDINESAKEGSEVNAYILAQWIVGPERDCPSFDITKEDEAVPQLLQWVVEQLNDTNAWIIIDHCDRKVMTRAARNLLTSLVHRIYNNDLQGVRLVLADFPRAALPDEVRHLVRYDYAELPNEQHVEEWCRQMATASCKHFDPDAPRRWASEVFQDLDQYSRVDGSWHKVLDKRLRNAAALVRACEGQQPWTR